MLSCVLKRISGLISERVLRELRYLTLFVRDANSFTIVILVLHNATTTSHACLLQTMKIAPAASAKPANETYIKYAS